MVRLTRHAIKRYCERIRPGADEREAREVLRDAVRRMTRNGERTWNGQPLWFVTKPDMRLVTKHDAKWGMILVTVLDPEPAQAESRTVHLSERQKKIQNIARAEAQRSAAVTRRVERAERHAALMASHAERRAAKVVDSAPRCAGPSGSGTCSELLNGYVSAWRRVDGVGICRECDAAMERDYTALSGMVESAA